MNVTEGAIDGIPLIVIEGELDQSSKQSAYDAVNEVLRGPFPPHAMLIDLTVCTSLDSG